MRANANIMSLFEVRSDKIMQLNQFKSIHYIVCIFLQTFFVTVGCMKGLKSHRPTYCVVQWSI